MNLLCHWLDKSVYRDWDENLLEEAIKGISEEFRLPPNSPGGRESYRSSLCLAFFLKFFTSMRRDSLTEDASCILDEAEGPMEATQLFHVNIQYIMLTLFVAPTSEDIFSSQHAN